MKINELIKEGALTLAVNANDLKEFAQDIVFQTKRELEEAIIKKQSERFVSTKTACELFDVDKTTLWRWGQKHYLIPIKVGGKKRYRMRDVEQILERGR
jgi:hypothetical protein